MGKSWGEDPQGLDFLFSPQFPYSIGEFNTVNKKDGLPHGSQPRATFPAGDIWQCLEPFFILIIGKWDGTCPVST